MDDLISRAGAIKAICEDGTKLEQEGRYILLMASRKQRDADILSALPTVDAVPVRHGRWKEDTGGYGFWICSHCGFVSEASAAYLLYRYCPHCGAKMDGRDGHGNG